MKRLGAAKGTGSGYRNLRSFPRDSQIHAQSARGMKQPQMRTTLYGWKDVAPFKNLSFPQLQKKGVYLPYQGDADHDGKVNVKDCKPLNPNAQADYKYFPVKKGVEIVCRYGDSRDGFNHFAILRVNGQDVADAKIHYINRTWESFEFESVIEKLLDKTNILTDAEKKTFLTQASGKAHEEVEQLFGSIAAVAKMGEIMANTQKEKNDWKKRMLKAGLPQLDVPEDWDTLSEDEKEKRLDKVISFMQKGK